MGDELIAFFPNLNCIFDFLHRSLLIHEVTPVIALEAGMSSIRMPSSLNPHSGGKPTNQISQPSFHPCSCHVWEELLSAYAENHGLCPWGSMIGRQWTVTKFLKPSGKRIPSQEAALPGNDIVKELHEMKGRMKT